MPAPSCSTRSFMKVYTSVLAPTSIPVVGSSMMNSPGFRVSPFAITIFCWLPPEKKAAPRSIRGGTILSRSASRAQIPRSLRRLRRTRPLNCGSGRAESAMFSRTFRSRTSPSVRRSGGRYTRPASSIFRGVGLVTGLPRKRMPPACTGSIPKHALPTSDLPEPTSPARPTISPAHTVSDTSRTKRPAPSPSTASSSSPGWWSTRGKNASILRPVISSTSFSPVASGTSSVATRRPSRSTVIRSPIRWISFMRWVM